MYGCFNPLQSQNQKPKGPNGNTFHPHHRPTTTTTTLLKNCFFLDSTAQPPPPTTVRQPEDVEDVDDELEDLKKEENDELLLADESIENCDVYDDDDDETIFVNFCGRVYQVYKGSSGCGSKSQGAVIVAHSEITFDGTDIRKLLSNKIELDKNIDNEFKLYEPKMEKHSLGEVINIVAHSKFTVLLPNGSNRVTSH
ncbi:hypothetical protein Tco_0725048 [Tanacetum coccineum]|uniref:Uncharacterized protein n=1 Tax=Tanacetum coccineum TaxID=301880 RepID=A0ABQ4YCQ4_9ASTR